VAEAVHIIRELLAGKRVDFSGKIFTCKGAKLRHTPNRRIPVYIGGRRQRMLELAGSIADGVLINASHLDDLKECVAYIRNGAKKSKRNLKDLDIAAYMATSIGDDTEKTRSIVKTVVAFITASSPESSLEYHDISLADVERVREHLRNGEIQKAAAAVTPSMIEAFSVCGPIAKLKARVDDLRGLGITQVVIGSPIGPEPAKIIRSIEKLL
jgi:5,10-methylenetetrahydromethanopterin reductase